MKWTLHRRLALLLCSLTALAGSTLTAQAAAIERISVNLSHRIVLLESVETRLKLMIGFRVTGELPPGAAGTRAVGTLSRDGERVGAPPEQRDHHDEHGDDRGGRPGSGRTEQAFEHHRDDHHGEHDPVAPDSSRRVDHCRLGEQGTQQSGGHMPSVEISTPSAYRPKERSARCPFDRGTWSRSADVSLDANRNAGRGGRRPMTTEEPRSL